MADLVEQDPSLPVYCNACEARICLDHGRLDCPRCASTAAPQGESVRLFTHAPAVMPGQLELG
jgi:Zn finger protein HypA/HybF involved in hydrogenase expression